MKTVYSVIALTLLASGARAAEFRSASQVVRLPYHSFADREGLLNLGPVALFLQGTAAANQKAFAGLKTSLKVESFRPDLNDISVLVRYESAGFRKVLESGRSELNVRLNLRILSCDGEMEFPTQTSAGQLQSFLASLLFTPADLASCSLEIRRVGLSDLSIEVPTVQSRILTKSPLNNLVAWSELHSARVVVDLTDEESLRFRSVVYRPGTTFLYEGATWGTNYRLETVGESAERRTLANEVRASLARVMNVLEGYRNELLVCLASGNLAGRTLQLDAYLEENKEVLRRDLRFVRENYAALPPFEQITTIRGMTRLIAQLGEADRAVNVKDSFERIIRTDR